MKNCFSRILLGVVLILVAGCAGATPPPMPVPPAATPLRPTATSVPPSATATLSPTNTPAPTNTPKPTATLLPPLGGGGGGVIAFVSGRGGDQEIYIMPAPGPQAQVNADGSNVRRLTNHPGQDHSPAWSPDGTRIAFVSDRDGNEEIYLMDPDGANLRRLTHNKAEDWFPAWSPDGKRIAFSSNRDGNHEIYVMPAPGSQAQVNADGNDQKRLTNNNAGDWGPVWRPQSP